METKRAEALIHTWKGDNYAFGEGAMKRVGEFARSFGETAIIVAADLGSEWVKKPLKVVTDSLDKAGISYSSTLGAAPNAPREDVYRIALQIQKNQPASIVAFGGGSTIDAAKYASVLCTYSADKIVSYLGSDESLASTVEPFFGVGNVTKIQEATGKAPLPVIAVESISSSGAHLTKYSNITDPASGQKKLIVDEAVVPPKAVFDYTITMGAPEGLTLDGGLDGIAHMWEVFMGATGKPFYEKTKEIAEEGIALIVENLPVAIKDPMNKYARIALGLGTDLGGYAIMVGGTNGGHLGSFSLVDVTSHGRACAILNPYYTVLFSSAIQEQLRIVGAVFKNAGYIPINLEGIEGRDLGHAVADGMIEFAKSMGFPVTLSEAGATEVHIERMINAAKNPQLASKLLNMPTPMHPVKGDVDNYMKPVLEAAFSGDFSLIKTMS